MITPNNTGWSISPTVETLFDRTSGVNIGNMTAGGASGLGGGFNGVLGQIASAGSGISGAPGSIGKFNSIPRAISKVVCYGTTNVGYVNTGATTQVSITLYGKNGISANWTDGSNLGSITFNQNAVNDTAPRTIVSNNSVTEYTHKWVYINGGSNSTYIGQGVFYEMFSGFSFGLFYITLSMLGDSIIANMALSGMRAPFTSASNLGHSGDTVAQIYARVGYIPVSATHVLLEGGTNDLVGLGTDAGIVSGYTSILNAIPSTKKVIMMGIPQVDEVALETAHPGWTFYLNNTKIAAVNASIATLCASYANCTVATALINLSMVGKTIDGIHPTAAGYMSIQQALSSYF